MPRPPKKMSAEELEELKVIDRRRKVEAAQRNVEKDKIFNAAQPESMDKITKLFGDISKLRCFHIEDEKGNFVTVRNGQLDESGAAFGFYNDELQEWEIKDVVHFKYDIYGRVREKSLPKFKTVRYGPDGTIESEDFESGAQINLYHSSVEVRQSEFKRDETGDYVDMKAMMEKLGEHPTFADVKKYIGQKIDERDKKDENSGHGPVLSSKERPLLRLLTKNLREKNSGK